MLDIKMLSISFSTAIWRFYLMMALVFIGGFSGIWAIALLALPVFLSVMLGIKFEIPKEAKSPVGQIRTMHFNTKSKKAG